MIPNLRKNVIGPHQYWIHQNKIDKLVNKSDPVRRLYQ